MSKTFKGFSLKNDSYYIIITRSTIFNSYIIIVNSANYFYSFEISQKIAEPFGIKKLIRQSIQMLDDMEILYNTSVYKAIKKVAYENVYNAIIDDI